MIIMAFNYEANGSMKSYLFLSSRGDREKQRQERRHIWTAMTRRKYHSHFQLIIKGRLFSALDSIVFCDMKSRNMTSLQLVLVHNGGISWCDKWTQQMTYNAITSKIDYKNLSPALENHFQCNLRLCPVDEFSCRLELC